MYDAERGVWVYDGHEITVSPSGQFCIAEGSSHGTLLLAEAAVDRMVSSRKARKIVSMALPVVTQAGVRAHVKAIHAGTGAMLFEEPNVDVQRMGLGSGLYVDVPWIVATIEEMRHLDTARKTLREKLDGYQLRQRSHGTVRDVGQTEQMLREDHEKLLQRANFAPEAEAWEELDWRPGEAQR